MNVNVVLYWCCGDVVVIMTCWCYIQDSRREDVLVNLCMRQSVQERRIAVQLMQVRREKDVIRRNRLAQEKQFEEARVKEFEEQLNKEKVYSLSYFFLFLSSQYSIPKS